MSGRKHGGFGGFGPWTVFGHGGPPWAGPWHGGPHGPRRGPKARRGDIRAAILSVLAEQPMNGYQIIQQVVERSQGAWKPSPGSIYPTLQQLEDEGLVKASEQGGRRAYELTEEGRTYVDGHPDEMSAPWEAFASSTDEDDGGLQPLLTQTAAALWQVMATGSPEQQARAREVLVDMRRRLYGILADGDGLDDDVDGGERP